MSEAHIVIEEELEHERVAEDGFAAEWALLVIGRIYEPRTYEEAISDLVYGQNWLEAIIRELQALFGKGTFRLA